MALFITPIERMDSVAAIDLIKPIQTIAEQTPGKKEATENALFKEILFDAVKNVQDSDRKVAQDQYLLSTGQLDDVHTLTIDSTKAGLSLDLLIALRGKAMEAYNELMRTNL